MGEIKVKFIETLELKSGESKNGVWNKQDFVTESLDKYPKKICFTIWNDKIDQLKGLKPDDEISVSYNLESREYNSKWYTDVVAWKIQSAASTLPQPPSESNPPPPIGGESSDLPF